MGKLRLPCYEGLHHLVQALVVVVVVVEWLLLEEAIVDCGAMTGSTSVVCVFMCHSGVLARTIRCNLSSR